MFRAIVLMLLFVAAPTRADDTLWALLAQGGQVVLIRHAVTDPGVGDPPGFKLDDCRTQRNLSAAGRPEAQRLGASLRAHGVPIARVLASPWCRTLETARLALGVEAQKEPALSNLFEHGHNRERQLAGFRKLVADAPRQGNLILVTHGATTLAFTGVSPATAEMVIITPEGGGEFKVAGRIPLAP
ncbi:MAG: histidine phosphatase family protein [Betaproteobacteria bacterium]